METITLNADKRDLLGKKVKKLRHQGKLPANLFGKKISSTAVSVDLKDFSKVYNEVGSTGVVELKLNGKDHPILISAVQADPRTDAYLHADLQEVNLKEKITASVPLVIEGESPAEKSGTGTFIQTLNEIEIESLPMDIPHEILVDVSSLEEVGQSIHVKDLKVDKSKIEIKTDLDATVALVEEAKVEEEAPVEAEEGVAEPEVTGEKGVGEEGAAESDEKKEE